jgi:hypothetical protein
MSAPTDKEWAQMLIDATERTQQAMQVAMNACERAEELQKANNELRLELAIERNKAWLKP